MMGSFVPVELAGGGGLDSVLSCGTHDSSITPLFFKACCWCQATS